MQDISWYASIPEIWTKGPSRPIFRPTPAPKERPTTLTTPDRTVNRFDNFLGMPAPKTFQNEIRYILTNDGVRLDGMIS